MNERQMKIVEWIVKEDKITNKEIKEMFGINRQSDYKEIKKLVDLDVID